MNIYCNIVFLMLKISCFMHAHTAQAQRHTEHSSIAHDNVAHSRILHAPWMHDQAVQNKFFAFGTRKLSLQYPGRSFIINSSQFIH